eukprot:4513449-Lingulodinium_polyedra.AAC.1
MARRGACAWTAPLARLGSPPAASCRGVRWRCLSCACCWCPGRSLSGRPITTSGVAPTSTT